MTVASMARRHAALAPDAAFDVFAALGGVEISVLGSAGVRWLRNATSKEGLAADAPHLDIEATVLFGGLEVKH